MGLDLSDRAVRFKAYCESPRIGNRHEASQTGSKAAVASK
jgi:hypothetical protein